MAVTGIIQRRSNKVNLISDPPVTGEIVFALDTGEHGWLDETSTLVWKKLDGESLPNGGTTGQVLSKTSNNDGDADWETLVDSDDELPVGGTTDQVLAKIDNTNGSVYWADAASGGGSKVTLYEPYQAGGRYSFKILNYDFNTTQRISIQFIEENTYGAPMTNGILNAVLPSESEGLLDTYTFYYDFSFINQYGGAATTLGKMNFSRNGTTLQFTVTGTAPSGNNDGEVIYELSPTSLNFTGTISGGG